MGPTGLKSPAPYTQARLFVPTEDSDRPNPPLDVIAAYTNNAVRVKWAYATSGYNDPAYWEVRGSSDWPNKGLSRRFRSDEHRFTYTNLTDRGTTYRWEVRTVGKTELRSPAPHKWVEIFVPQKEE